MGARYHLFAYDQYYPGGGMGDYCGSFDSPDDAAVYIRGSAYRDFWHMAIVNEHGNLEETEHDWCEFHKEWRIWERTNP